ncbi:MAG TPA: hypothetical protein VM364_20535 [Vicinamibacterales bacterium]|nr:hypothetical protein [Vicinamibacterales bacterium]
MEHRLRLVQGGGARTEKRASERIPVQLPGQIVWKDAKGRTQMAAVVTRDVSETGVSIECRTSLTIPQFRLVYFQIDRHLRHRPELPPALRKQNVLAAVFRVGPASDVTGTPTVYGLRLLVEPRRAGAATSAPGWIGRPADQPRVAGCTRTA